MSSDQRDQLFPIFVKLAGRPCTVVGGGEVALRKVRSLLDCSARVRVVAPDLCPSLRSLVEEGNIEHIAREYRAGDLEGSTLAFAATGDSNANEAVHGEAERLGIPVNVVDDPGNCTFYVPSQVARGPVQIAISTQGASPALARRLREMIEEAVPPEYGRFASLLGSLRAEVMAAHASPDEREARWRSMLDSEALSLLRDGKSAEAEALARRLLGLMPDAAPRRTSLDRITIGTRGSKLALAQAGMVATRLRELGVQVSTVTIRTTGDRQSGAISGSLVGVFVREIERALLDGEADLAVHSMKDLPTGPRPGLVVAAVPVREDPGDVLVTPNGQRLAELPAGSRVATSSPRRVAQLGSLRPDLVFVEVRGNIDTRLRKLADGDFDALVLAHAGLARLGLSEVACERLPSDSCLPAPGQGALALQVREEDTALRELLAQLDHRPSRLAVQAERAFLERIGAGCSIPAGALAVIEEEELSLEGVLGGEGGGQLIRDKIRGPADAASTLGAELADRILAAAPDRTAVDQS
jgi:hydroxymethylbilane synthase